jgi:hypothetical protein
MALRSVCIVRIIPHSVLTQPSTRPEPPPFTARSSRRPPRRGLLVRLLETAQTPCQSSPCPTDSEEAEPRTGVSTVPLEVHGGLRRRPPLAHKGLDSPYIYDTTTGFAPVRNIPVLTSIFSH